MKLTKTILPVMLLVASGTVIAAQDPEMFRDMRDIQRQAAQAPYHIDRYSNVYHHENAVQNGYEHHNYHYNGMRDRK